MIVSKWIKLIRWLIATAGAAIVFIGVFIITGVVLARVWPGGFFWKINLGFTSSNNPIGLILGALAATHSFRASLKYKSHRARPT